MAMLKHKMLLKTVPKFDQNLPFMDITSTESKALNMEHNHKENEAETIRQNVSNILQKNINLKIKSNLRKKMKEEHQKNYKKMIKLECTNLIRVADSQL